MIDSCLFRLVCLIASSLPPAQPHACETRPFECNDGDAGVKQRAEPASCSESCLQTKNNPSPRRCVTLRLFPPQGRCLHAHTALHCGICSSCSAQFALCWLVAPHVQLFDITLLLIYNAFRRPLQVCNVSMCCVTRDVSL